MFDEKEIKMILSLIGFAFSESCHIEDAEYLFKKIKENYKSEEIQEAVKDLEDWC